MIDKLHQINGRKCLFDYHFECTNLNQFHNEIINAFFLAPVKSRPDSTDQIDDGCAQTHCFAANGDFRTTLAQKTPIKINFLSCVIAGFSFFFLLLFHFSFFCERISLEWRTRSMFPWLNIDFWMKFNWFEFVFKNALIWSWYRALHILFLLKRASVRPAACLRQHRSSGYAMQIIIDKWYTDMSRA